MGGREHGGKCGKQLHMGGDTAGSFQVRGRRGIGLVMCGHRLRGKGREEADHAMDVDMRSDGLQWSKSSYNMHKKILALVMNTKHSET